MHVDSKTREALEDILARREGLRSLQAQLKEDVQVLAELLGLKPAQLSRFLSLVEREREKGGVLEAERSLLDTVEMMVGRSEEPA